MPTRWANLTRSVQRRRSKRPVHLLSTIGCNTGRIDEVRRGAPVCSRGIRACDGSPAQQRMSTVLVIDDEPRIAAIAGDYLRHAGFDVVTAATGGAGLERAREAKPALIVLDLRLPDMDGIRVA